MIVEMKRLTLICLSSQREDTLRKLQDMGVVHVTSLKPPDSRALETSRNHLAYIKRALETMPRKTATAPSGVPSDVVVSLVWTMLQDKKDIEHDLDELRQERNRIAPFGEFDPGMIVGLRQHGVFVKLYAVSLNLEAKAPDHAALVEIARDKTTAYLALFARDEQAALPVTEFRLPDRSLNDLDDQIKEMEARLADCIASLKIHEGDHVAVAMLRDQLEDTVHFLEARDGMGSAAPIAYLRGYIPADHAGDLLEAARREGWGVNIEVPDPDEDVPTKIINPKWIKPIEAVLKGINVLPGYREADMSAAFLVFFSLFFAILIGDAGYGLLFLLGTRIARRKFPTAPSEPFHLLTLTSACTIVWGVITGTYFGAATIPGVLEGLRVNWLSDTNNMMSLCFLIGAIHLTVAHGWNILRMFPSLQALAQAGWIAMTWTMYFVAHMLVLNQKLPAVIPWVAAVGAVLILAFMTPREKFKSEWFNHVMFPLNVVSNFVDVVSYIRLFAVGFASLAVAQAFNAMAMGGGISGPVAALGAALILFLGHALNIVLGAMGILVHGVRLNTLEFSSHLGVQWTGRPYEPFARKQR
jgi:V/A-type H+-transporting ATPase subunit I